MRILHVVPTYLPARRYGGPIVSVHGLCRALAARGHDVHVFTTNVDGDGVSDVPLGETADLDGVRVHYHAAPLPRLYWSPAMHRALNTDVAGFDIVHTHSVYLWPGVAAARAARRAGVPYVISPRGMLVPELIARKSRWAKTVWLRVLESRGFVHASAIHFTSQLEWEDARRVGLPLPAPVVVPNGVDVLSRPAVVREERLLVFLGRITWKKGLEPLIEALPNLGARLVIAGNDEENLTPRLRELARNVGAEVEFTGPVYDDAKYELLARATLFVLLSTSENFGNAVLEALSMETPAVLSAEVGLAGEVVAAGAGVIGLGEVPFLLTNPSRRAEMGRRGRDLVERRFSWPRIGGQMEEAYCSIRSRR